MINPPPFPSQNAPQLQELLEGCLSQEPAAQKGLFKLYFGYAKSICLRYCSDKNEAEEVLNSGFLKVFQHLDKYDNLQPFRAWLRVIMIRTAIDYQRKGQKYSNTIPLADTYDIAVNENILDEISAEELLNLIQTLPTSYRTVFMLYAVDGYNHREIGELLGISEGTSKSNLAVARSKLKQLLLTQYPQTRFISNS